MIPEDLVIVDGMAVYGSDGEKIGTVSQVWPTVEDTVGGISTTGVFQVHHGGILGIGAQHLYVPYVAVHDYVPGERVTLTCSMDECAQLYAHQPGSPADSAGSS